MDQYQIPTVMDKQLDVLHCHADGGLLLGASCLTGRYWLGSLWFYQNPRAAPDVDRCTAGVQLEAGVGDAGWVDATHVLVGLDTGGVALWQLEDDYHTFVLSQAAQGHDHVVSSVSVLSDHSKAASSGHDRCIKLWDLPTVSLLYSAQAHLDTVTSIDCHPSEPDLFISCGQDDRILLWDKRKPKPASLLNKSPLQNTATCVRWQPGQTHKLALGSESGQLAILDTRVGVENYLTARPHQRPVYNMQFCPSKPSLLASVGEDCRTVVTSLQEDSLKQEYLDITHTDFVHGVAWSSDSELYTCGWDAKVLSHDLTRGVATSLGQAVDGSSTVQMNGDVVENGVDARDLLGAGDGSEGKSDQSTSSPCKSPSYSQAVKTSSQEITAEG
ncbi:methylosome protein 50 [Aplysia californica]|uniref:Methylosome protein 50 n=1 Tax=Aplysia californica TaxID=6500 RepID=A0ABM1A1G2_APLCA|nr:methylosome protein 50 [Aplysia californica]